MPNDPERDPWPSSSDIMCTECLGGHHEHCTGRNEVDTGPCKCIICEAEYYNPRAE